MKFLKSLVYGTFTTASLMSSQNLAVSESFHLKGVCEIGETWILSIEDKRHGHSLWLQVGQSRGDLRVVSFDENAATATLDYGGSIFSLALAEAELLPFQTVQAPILTSQEFAEIERKTEDYRQGLTQVLSGSSNSEARSPQEKRELGEKIEKRVADYRKTLIDSYAEKSQTGELAGSTLEKSAGFRRQNRVNSRIWASDHIEKWGEPVE